MNRGIARPFSVVLGGGGARGFAHAGILRALELMGLRPAGVVGVSMGSLVGAAYAHRQDWYEAVLTMDVSAFPGPVDPDGPPLPGLLGKARRGMSYLRMVRTMALGWGLGAEARSAGMAELRRLFGDQALEAGRIPLAVSATDLSTGRRVVLDRGPVVDAVYASAALAGILPPLKQGALLLADGAYTDIAPVDVARTLVPGPVIAVDPGQDSETGEIRNGFRAIMRAVEICHRQHSELRFGQADLVLRPLFPIPIDVLDFGARRECVAAGLRAVRSERTAIRRVLGDLPGAGRGSANH